MANNLISSFLSSTALVIKNATTQSAAIAPGFKVQRVSIKLTSTLMRHMREDGSTIVDARIIQPTTMTVDGFIPDIDTFNQLNTMLNDRSNFYSISSKGISLQQMMAESDQIKQSPDMMTAMPTRISLKQVITKDSTPVVLAQSSDSALMDRGLTLLNSATLTITGLASSVAKLF